MASVVIVDLTTRNSPVIGGVAGRCLPLSLVSLALAATTVHAVDPASRTDQSVDLASSLVSLVSHASRHRQRRTKIGAPIAPLVLLLQSCQLICLLETVLVARASLLQPPVRPVLLTPRTSGRLAPSLSHLALPHLLAASIVAHAHLEPVVVVVLAMALLAMVPVTVLAHAMPASTSPVTGVLAPGAALARLVAVAAAADTIRVRMTFTMVVRDKMCFAYAHRIWTLIQRQTRHRQRPSWRAGSSSLPRALARLPTSRHLWARPRRPQLSQRLRRPSPTRSVLPSKPLPAAVLPLLNAEHCLLLSTGPSM